MDILHNMKLQKCTNHLSNFKTYVEMIIPCIDYCTLHYQITDFVFKRFMSTQSCAKYWPVDLLQYAASTISTDSCDGKNRLVIIPLYSHRLCPYWKNCGQDCVLCKNVLTIYV